MGTNFYARIIPSEKAKQELVDAILTDADPDLIEELTQKLYGSRNIQGSTPWILTNQK